MAWSVAGWSDLVFGPFVHQYRSKTIEQRVYGFRNGILSHKYTVRIMTRAGGFLCSVKKYGRTMRSVESNSKAAAMKWARELALGDTAKDSNQEPLQ